MCLLYISTTSGDAVHLCPNKIINLLASVSCSLFPFLLSLTQHSHLVLDVEAAVSCKQLNGLHVWGKQDVVQYASQAVLPLHVQCEGPVQRCTTRAPPPQGEIGPMAYACKCTDAESLTQKAIFRPLV